MEMYSLEKEWKDCLARLALDEKLMPSDQRRMMKQAFIAGVSQTMVLLREGADLAAGDEEQEIVRLQDLWNQCLQYWQNETSKKN
jgi:hypothetical protein